ncbi:c-type cytochrome [Azohydromonas lata]|uniref:C-type cytochrome n=1 Tax=Azohydromonas lata TaxID=45677 RepID=A0ABU5IPU8_9BURK|nr:c-type cytochrome [Azohydromonas lata]MDZ5460906.1 c-type cytochrome [Azohydromonas lata]
MKPACRRLSPPLLALLLCALPLAGGAQERTNPLAGDAQAARSGEDLFGRNCQQCHNSRGKGGKGPQLIRGAWGPGGANSDAFMFQTIANGRPNTQMGGFGGSLSETEIWQIVTFLRAESQRAKAAERQRADDVPNW